MAGEMDIVAPSHVDVVTSLLAEHRFAEAVAECERSELDVRLSDTSRHPTAIVALI
jgi:hypothetical protein